MSYTAAAKPIVPHPALEGLTLDQEAFVNLLRKLISESEHVQNNPGQLVPEEGRIAKHVVDELRPFSTEAGGPLKVELLEYVKNRPNVKITYPGKTDKTVGIIGSHMDVVPANPESWKRNPFELTIEGDRLYGRGTTDCLGHVAMITRLMADLAKAKPELERTIVVLFIAGEEGGEDGVGVDMVVKHGEIDLLRNGPVFWVDSSDSQPCIGTAGSLPWTLEVKGRLFHSGLPHLAINSLELAMEASKEIQRRFYEDFPAHPQEEKYNFATPSTMKPTQVECSKGATNQIPAWTKVGTT